MGEVRGSQFVYPLGAPNTEGERTTAASESRLALHFKSQTKVTVWAHVPGPRLEGFVAQAGLEQLRTQR